MRPDRAEKFGRALALEDHDKIDATQSSEHFGAIILSVQRTPLAFEFAHRSVAIQTDDERVAERAGLLQISHVAGMEQIETAVGENETLAGSVHGIPDRRHFRGINHASLVHAPENRIGAVIAQHLARRLE